MKSPATSVADYLQQLAPDRRVAIEAVRRVVLKHLPKGYEEVMQYGMLGYVVPLKAYPLGYLNRGNEPVPYVCLASQKNYMSIYLMSAYGPGEKDFRKAYAATGKKLDMGKSCIRFRRVEDLALDVIGKAVARWPLQEWVAICEASWSKRK